MNSERSPSRAILDVSAGPPRSSTAYGRIGALYPLLEYIALGTSLQRTRETFLEELAGCTRVAVFGAGDGRCFAPLLKAAPAAAVDSIDVDPRFSRLAQARVQRLPGGHRVTFIRQDARNWTGGAAVYDAVVTQFFLDCFPPDDLTRVVGLISQSLRPEGRWLFGDFNIPSRPHWAHYRARLWIRTLCAFFGWAARHPLKSLPPMEETILQQGFTAEHVSLTNGGLLKAAVYRKSSQPVHRAETAV